MGGDKDDTGITFGICEGGDDCRVEMAGGASMRFAVTSVGGEGGDCAVGKVGGDGTGFAVKTLGDHDFGVCEGGDDLSATNEGGDTGVVAKTLGDMATSGGDLTTETCLLALMLSSLEGEKLDSCSYSA